MRVRIKEDRYLYTIQVKKHWWSRWENVMFTDTIHEAVMVSNELVSQKTKK